MYLNQCVEHMKVQSLNFTTDEQPWISMSKKIFYFRCYFGVIKRMKEQWL